LIVMAPRHFTREEAERLIPHLADPMRRLQEAKRDYDEYEGRVAELSMKMGGNGHLIEGELKDAQEGLARAAGEVNRLVEQVHDLGCELKGIEEGLIDFRAEMDGREVYLCWKLGEDAITWWHELDTGFAGRQPLERE
jgi:hypothetical protein